MATVGFLGLGIMGAPMAANLARAGTPLIVWNRSTPAAVRLGELGAEVAASAQDVIAACDVTLMMLRDEAAIDATLRRGTVGFGAVRGRTIVHMGTTPPEYSAALGRDVVAAGGNYVEAPVSGSRGPAETGDLVAMVAGAPPHVTRVRPLLAPMCRDAFDCGPVPNGLLMKLAINTFLITMVTGLAEAYQLAERFGLDLDTFVAVHDAGPMASRVSTRKAGKLRAGDFAVEAGLADVFKNNRFVVDAAHRRGIAVPLMDVCHELYQRVVDAGLGDQDMAAVVRAFGTTERDHVDVSGDGMLDRAHREDKSPK